MADTDTTIVKQASPNVVATSTSIPPALAKAIWKEGEWDMILNLSDQVDARLAQAPEPVKDNPIGIPQSTLASAAGRHATTSGLQPVADGQASTDHADAIEPSTVSPHSTRASFNVIEDRRSERLVTGGISIEKMTSLPYQRSTKNNQQRTPSDHKEPDSSLSLKEIEVSPSMSNTMKEIRTSTPPPV